VLRSWWRRRRYKGFEGEEVGRCAGRCEVLFGGRFDWNLPRERLFLSRNIETQRRARRIVEGWRLAADDPYRAVTHNKGIMNGVDALALGERAVASFLAAVLTEIYLCASRSCHEISRSATARVSHGPGLARARGGRPLLRHH
jgi:hypothetical protein